MSHTNMTLGDNWAQGEWPESIAVGKSTEPGCVTYVPERTCRLEPSERGIGLKGWRCSECGGSTVADSEPPFCSRCGAKAVGRS